MADVVSGLPPEIKTLLILVLAWVAKEFWDLRKKREEKHEDAVTANTEALIELKSELKALKETFKDFIGDYHKRVGNLEDDVDALHDLRRREQ